MSETVLDRLVVASEAALDVQRRTRRSRRSRCCGRMRGRQWEPVIDRIGERLPVVTLGEYDLTRRRGPAYWVRCVVAGTVDIGLPEGPPIVYLPGVARSELRAVETCPPELAPIAELQYRSQWFSHPNSRDWTVRALLVQHRPRSRVSRRGRRRHQRGLLWRSTACSTSRSTGWRSRCSTRTSSTIWSTPTRSAACSAGSTTRWASRTRLDDAQWTAFVQQCKADYGFDPDGRWRDQRRAQAGQARRPVGEGLEAVRRDARAVSRASPSGFARREPHGALSSSNLTRAWPQDNEMAEDQLRSLSARLRGAHRPSGARKEAARLDAEHAWRRGTVWADLDLAPLAFALEQLAGARRADRAARSPPVISRRSCATTPSAAGGPTMRCCARSRPLERPLTARPCRRRRRRCTGLGSTPVPRRSRRRSVRWPTPTPTSPARRHRRRRARSRVFVDGLRLDVAHRCRQRLADAVFDASNCARASPRSRPSRRPPRRRSFRIAGRCSAGPELHAGQRGDGHEGNDPGAALADGRERGAGPRPDRDRRPVGHGVDRSGRDRPPRARRRRAAGRLSRRGGRADRGRIRELLDAGWKRVDVVTDHGWMLLPGGMEKVELPAADD